MSTNEDPTTYTKKDFMSDQTIRWCPGCGDYSILSQVQTVLASLGRPKHEFAVISGIGCSSRFPYYMNTYGFHTIHGRAPAFATGLKLANPDLSVWQITGDGDALSIGGNHLLHVLRRNIDIQILLFNNRIYGLTKGQYSPTSEVGKKTKSTPMGSVDHPIEPCAFALGADATFVARTVDIFVKHQRQILTEAYHHLGTSFLEIFQNCNIFNDGAFKSVTNRKTKDNAVVYCEHGKPLVFGSKLGPKKGLHLSNSLSLEIVTIGEDGITEEDILVHDETNQVLATMLVRLKPPFPVAMGVIYRVQRARYEEAVHNQIAEAKKKLNPGDITKALYDGNTWIVEDDVEEAAKKTSTGSHYRQIDGNKYSAALLSAADDMVAGKGDGRISADDAESLLDMLKNDHKYTDLEKETLSYIRQNYKFTDAGDAYLRDAIRSWAAIRGHNK